MAILLISVWKIIILDLDFIINKTTSINGGSKVSNLSKAKKIKNLTKSKKQGFAKVKI